MARVKSKDTTPEIALRKALYALGARGWRCNRSDLPGKPDLAFGRLKVAIFVDGGFWHGHPTKYWQGRSGPYWDAKIRKNQERNRRANAELKALGWRVLRLWDFEIEADPDAAADRVADLLAEAELLDLSDDSSPVEDEGT